MTNYTEVLKECGYDAVSHVLDEMISKLAKRRA